MLYSILILVATLPNSYLITFPPDWKQAWQPLPKCVWVSFLFLSFFFIIFPKLNFVLASRRPLGTSVISAFLFALALLSMAFTFRVRSKSTGCNSRKAWESLRKSDWWLGEDGEHPSSVYCVGASACEKCWGRREWQRGQPWTEDGSTHWEPWLWSAPNGSYGRENGQVTEIHRKTRSKMGLKR